MRFAAAFVFLLCGLCGPAFAGDVHVACVQNQLSALGQDPGPVDGQSGPRTKAALAALVAQSGPDAQTAYARLPGFSRRAAVGWCREIGRFHLDALPFLPSYRMPEVHVSDEVSPQMRRALLAAHAQARSYMAERYGVRLASQVEIAAAVSPQAFRELVRTTEEGQQIPGTTLRASAERNCLGARGLGGSMYRDVMTFCGLAMGVADGAQLRIARDTLTSVMVHEYVHHMQREMAYDKVERWVRKGQRVRRRLGPAWMVEGTAEVLESRYWTRDTHVAGDALFLLRARAIAAQKTLASVRTDNEVRTAGAYAVSHYAAALLAGRYGDRSLIDFWRAVGETDNWYDAFAQVYGMSVQDFEKLYQTMLESRAFGLEFVQDIDIDGDGLIAGREALPPVAGGAQVHGN
ncbi:peptidoglycan-binding domain-containing protein [Sagittula stellata]|uniref:DUF2268 domain-containing protein n=1 Tax=Sagittula stellata (strain ATCC 700073 / DSM 11524 / E-37) TaxID=388399 RepID=A3KB92_SAGS3|nr:peptidoglycan-binding protein [Sagittula stellata]EBA05564.1 hypothetical protein SSE37_14434 [Sagittula stellata E-37]